MNDLQPNKIFEFMTKHPICQLATCKNNIPRVRHMMLFRADENGIIFHTSSEKDLVSEILDNNNVELCFLNINTFTQLRLSGKAVLIHDPILKQEITAHPSRRYLKMLKELHTTEDFFGKLAVFKIVECIAHVWTVQTHYDQTISIPKSYFSI